MKKSKQELRQDLLKWLKAEKWDNKKFFSIPLQRFVYFTKSGFKHTIYRNYKNPEIELQIAKNIPKILPNSLYMGLTKDEKKIESVIGVHNYYDIIAFKGDLYEVWFKVKETKEKTYFYDHGIIRKL